MEEKSNETNKFTFFKSFYDAICDLKPKEQLELYTAICEYAFYGNEDVKMSKMPKTLFKTIKPNISTKKKQAKGGHKGGRPKKETLGYEDEETKEEKTFTQDDIDRIVKQEKARLERKYRRDEESKLSKAKQLEETLRTGLGLSEQDDVLSKVKDFYKEQGVSIPDNYSISDKDAQILGREDKYVFNLQNIS